MAIDYLRPAFGGVYDYSETIAMLLRERLKLQPHVITIGKSRYPILSGRRLAKSLRHPTLAELGSGDRTLLWSLYFSRQPYVVTIHDPGVVVDSVFRIQWLRESIWPLPGIERRYSNLMQAVLGRRVIAYVISRAQAVVCLNQSVSEIYGVETIFLPQATYHEAAVKPDYSKSFRIGYMGYWSPAKGLTELIHAYRQVADKHQDVECVLAGSGAGKDDGYVAEIRAQAASPSPAIKTPGFIPAEQMDAFLSSLSVLVLPYRPEVPGAASGMVMRAQELGLPMIVSDLPSFRSQIKGGAIFVQPGDANALADAIEQAVEMISDLRKDALAEQERIYTTNGWDAITEELRCILPTATSSHNRSTS